MFRSLFESTLNTTEKGTLRESPSQTYVEWTVKRTSRFMVQPDSYIESPSFSLSDTKWSFGFYPKNELKDGTLGSEITLVLVGKNVEKDYEIQCTMGVKDVNGSVFMSSNLKFKFNKSNAGFGIPALFLKSTLLSSSAIIAPDGSFTVFCSARVVRDTKEIATQISRDGTATLSENFRDLYKDGRFTDATLVVQGREFFVHRNVLVTRSTVFSAMFETNMTEKSSARVEISDCDPDSFENVLLFLYTGKLDMVSSRNAMSLYETAEKYDLKDLKEECVHCMASELSVDSICDVVRLAVLHKESELLKASIEFFIGNAKTILETIKWQRFIVENPLLGNDMIIKFIEMKNKR